MTSENDPLLEHLLELGKKLDAVNIPIILGGGMSLYLRLKDRKEPTERYPFVPPTRSTNDLDLFLSSKLIVDAGQVNQLRQILGELEYAVSPQAKNFQFVKVVKVFGEDREVKVDLLTAPPAEIDLPSVEIKRPRIKPHGAREIHAYLTDEAEGIEIGSRPIDVSRYGLTLKNQVLAIPSAYNYLILKLHAYEDRKDKNDAKSRLGMHHAFDLFATVTVMEEGDWAAAASHRAAHAGKSYLVNAAKIAQSDFAAPTSKGLIRMRDYSAYRENRATYDLHLEKFIKDLADLFPA